MTNNKITVLLKLKWMFAHPMFFIYSMKHFVISRKSCNFVALNI